MQTILHSSSGCVISEFYFGQPAAGRFAFSAMSTASIQLPLNFIRSGSGPFLVRFGALAFTIASVWFFFIVFSNLIFVFCLLWIIRDDGRHGLRCDFLSAIP